MNVLAKKAFYTNAIVLFDNIVVGKRDVSFGFAWHEDSKVKSFSSLTLIRGDEETELAADATKAEGLMSDVDYTLSAKYLNDGKEEEISLDFHTYSLLAPTVEIVDIESTTEEISFKLDIVDEDEIINLQKVEILDGDKVVGAIDNLQGDEFRFSELSSYTEYTIKASYSYDLNDGSEEFEKTVEAIFSTKPIYSIKETKCINTNKVSYGDTIYLEIEVENPSSFEAKRAMVNGIWYDASVSGEGKVIVNIVNEGQFIGGDTQLEIQAIEAQKGGEQFNFETSGSASCFVNGDIELVYIDFVNDKFEPIDFAYNDEIFYIHVHFNNPTGYTIDSVEIDGWDNDAMKWISDGENKNDLYSEYNKHAFGHGFGSYSVKAKSFKYHNDSLNKEKGVDTMGEAIIAIVRNIGEEKDEQGNYIPISNAEDLKNIESGNRYKLTADITIDENWTPIDFYGVLDGAGHSIKGLNIVTTYYNENKYIGLFNILEGIVYDLRIENVKIIVDVKNGNITCGALAAHSQIYLMLKNVSTSGDIICDADFTQLGGLIGSANRIKIYDCANNCKISGKDDIGGLVGYGDGTISNSYNTGDVSGNDHVGGLIGYSYDIEISDSYNTGAISGNNEVGGLVGYGENTEIINSYNTGAISGDTSVGGLVGRGSCVINNSYNMGTVSGNREIGGLIGYGKNTEIIKSYNTGAISGDTSVGGLVGRGSCVINNSYNMGTVSGNDNVGGLIGYGTTMIDISNSYNTGAVNSNGSVGGLVGYGENIEIINSYNMGVVSGQCVGGLIGIGEKTITITGSYYIAEGIDIDFATYNIYYNDTNVTITDCYHVSNGTQGTKLDSNEALVKIIEELWDKNVWDFENTIDGINPSLKELNKAEEEPEELKKV